MKVVSNLGRYCCLVSFRSGLPRPLSPPSPFQGSQVQLTRLSDGVVIPLDLGVLHGLKHTVRRANSRVDGAPVAQHGEVLEAQDLATTCLGGGSKF